MGIEQLSKLNRVISLWTHYKPLPRYCLVINMLYMESFFLIMQKKKIHKHQMIGKPEFAWLVIYVNSVSPRHRYIQALQRLLLQSKQTIIYGPWPFQIRAVWRFISLKNRGMNSDQDFHLKTNTILLTEANALLKTDFGVMVLWKYINFKDITAKNTDRSAHNIYWLNFFSHQKW